MCDICLKSPCHPRCPNSLGPTPVFICSHCGHDILDGDRVWNVMGEQFCEECIDSFESVAEAEDEYAFD